MAASVRATLRVVRFSSRMPRPSSSERMVWLMVGGEMPTWAAARVKLRCSATATKAVSSASTVIRANVRQIQTTHFEYSELSHPCKAKPMPELSPIDPRCAALLMMNYQVDALTLFMRRRSPPTRSRGRPN